METQKFQGCYTAIITPFKEDGSVDFGSLADLLEFNIESKITGIVPCGTTGESPTLSHKEHDEVIRFTIEYVHKRVQVIAGTGSNSTDEAIQLSQHAEKAGADALLLVTPYYNKPTQEGLYRHFKKIADNVGIPCIPYNVPPRTKVNIETDTLLRIIDSCSNIVGVKEASGDLNQIQDVIKRTPDYFSVLSGDDNIALQVIKMKGQGIISVASNIVPEKMSSMIYAALQKSWEQADSLNAELSPLFTAEFIETNPIPIKYMLALQGRCQEVYRLPMCEPSDEHKQELKQVMNKYNLL